MSEHEQKVCTPNLIRVMRILVYTYSDAETAICDQKKWQVPANGTYPRQRGGEKWVTINSAVLPPEILEGV